MGVGDVKRVAIFIPSLNGGGAERVMLTLANHLAKTGIQTDLVLVKAKGPYLSDVHPLVNVCDLQSTRVLFSLTRLRQYLVTSQPDVLLSAMSHANVVAAIAHMLSSSPTRLMVSERNMPSRSKKSLVGWVTLCLQRLTYRRAEKIIAVSRGCAQEVCQLLKVDERKVEVVYSPLITEDMFLRSKDPIRHPWALDKEIPIILGVGRLVEIKGFDTLIRAFARVRRHMKARLVILGEGPLRNELVVLANELSIQDDLFMPGFVKNPFQWMAKARVFVLSSRMEGLPGALVQALSLGAEAVVTDCVSGVREVLQGGGYGRLVDVDDPDAMAQEIRDVLMADDKSREKYNDKRFTTEYAVGRFKMLMASENA